MPALPGWGCRAEAPRDAGGRRRSQAVAGAGHSPRTPLSCARLAGSLRFSHRHRQRKGKCAFASEDGTTRQRDFTGVPSQMTEAFHCPGGEGKEDGEGVYKVKLIWLLPLRFGLCVLSAL